MDITVLGVGEASDPAFANSSSLVHHDGYSLLIDCGHSVPSSLWRLAPEPDRIDAIYFTHGHPDHCFGLVPVLIQWKDDGRTRPLDIVASAPTRRRLDLILEAGETRGHDLPYAVRWHEPKDMPALGPFAARYAATVHSIPNQAIRLDAGQRSFAYSGDGQPTEKSAALYRGADLLFHECYTVETDPAQRFHTDLAVLGGLIAEWAPGDCRLYHIRKDQRAGMEAAVAAGRSPRLAVPGERIAL